MIKYNQPEATPPTAKLHEALQMAMGRSSYYARRSGFFQGALEVIAMGVIDDCVEASARVLHAAGEDYFDKSPPVTKPRPKNPKSDSSVSPKVVGWAAIRKDGSVAGVYQSRDEAEIPWVNCGYTTRPMYFAPEE